MTPERGIRRLVRMPGRLARIQREVDDEMSFHLTSRIEALTAAGHAPAQAREIALREFGDLADARRDLTRIDRGRARRSTVSSWLSAVRGDLWYALRGVRRSPAFAATVVVTLAIGIGVNAAMFGIVDRLLLRPAPQIVNAEGLRSMYYRVTLSSMGTFTGDSRGYADYVDLAKQGTSFAAVGAYYPIPLSVGRGSSAGQVNSILATASFLPMLGVHPFIGRFFGADEDRPPIGVPVAVLSYAYWRRAFGGSSDVLGKNLELNGKPFTIIGVAPSGFRGVGTEPVDVFVPVSSLGGSLTSPNWDTTYGWQWLRIVTRLKDGVSPVRAAQEATTIFRRAHAKNDEESRATAVLASVIPGRGPNETKNAQLALLLSAVAAIVLLIATANVANLLVTRAVRRQREIAVRTALGVSRRRLLSQLITESTVLAALGGAGALIVAWGGGALLRRLVLPDFAPDDSLVDLRIFAVASVVALSCGLVTGLAPAFISQRTDFVGALKSGAREGGYRRSRLRTSLLVLQAALSVTLLIGAALFVRSLTNVLSIDLGYDAQHTMVVSQNLGSAGFDKQKTIAFMRRAREQVTAIPGVAEASVAVTVPFMSSWSTHMRVAGIDSLPPLPDGGPYVNAVSYNYFSTMGMRILRGRGFANTDVKGAPPVAVINESMASTIFRGRDPLGVCLFVGGPSAPCAQIVGVVRDTHRQSINAVQSAQYFLVEEQEVWSEAFNRVLMLRTTVSTDAVKRQVAAAMQQMEGALPYASVQRLQELVEPEIRTWRLGASLFVVFGSIALLVAMVGLYSVVSFDTAQRTHEVGVRIALGARSREILKLVVSDGLRSALVGVIVGVSVAALAAGAITPLLFGVSARDPAVFGLAALVLLVVAIVASALPAARAARVAPSEALRVD